jgi:hypothetical protein
MMKYTCVFLLGAAILCAQPPGAPQPAVVTTGMVGVAEAQTAQLNLLNRGVLAPAVGVICSAQVEFLDESGTVLKSTTLTIPPGQSKAFQLRSDLDLNLTVAGDRREIRAVIMSPPVTPVSGTSTTAPPPACKLVATLEVFDTVSGRTLVNLGRVVVVPAVVTTP